ncbi:hypothetical protein PTW35_00645 [Photobacterium sp. DA100]|nr:hypothetical protein [Photobacterium sp. DA100]WEM44089.1 hypothetical protein PTW35_00645 [Photobacterium sp. DA100]
MEEEILHGVQTDFFQFFCHFGADARQLGQGYGIENLSAHRYFLLR